MVVFYSPALRLLTLVCTPIYSLEAEIARKQRISKSVRVSGSIDLKLYNCTSYITKQCLCYLVVYILFHKQLENIRSGTPKLYLATCMYMHHVF